VFKRNVMVLCLTGVCRNEYFTSFNGFKNRAKFVNFHEFRNVRPRILNLRRRRHASALAVTPPADSRRGTSACATSPLLTTRLPRKPRPARSLYRRPVTAPCSSSRRRCQSYLYPRPTTCLGDREPEEQAGLVTAGGQRCKQRL